MWSIVFTTLISHRRTSGQQTWWCEGISDNQWGEMA